jgi:hypothetical protein
MIFFPTQGIVPPNREESDEDKVLKGVVRVEMVQNPADYIPTILARLIQIPQFNSFQFYF